MAELDAAFFVFTIAFGALIGYGLGRHAEDRTPTRAACAASVVVGAVTWAIATPGTTPETAGASMTVGCLAALLVLVLTGRTPGRANGLISD